jgi:ribosomal protein S6--L-glutamate ligase
MKILIVSKNWETYFIKRLMSEVGNKEVELYNPWSSLRPPERGHSYVFTRTSGIYGDDRDLKFLTSFDQRLINPWQDLSRFRRKSDQYQILKIWELPVLPWLDLFVCSDRDLAVFFENNTKPFLIKPNRGQGGWGVRVFLEKEDFFNWWNKTSDKDYVLQPFISKCEEERLFFIRSDFILPLIRTSEEGAAANFAQNGQARLMSVSPFHHALVSALLDKTTLFYGAIDLLQTQQGPVILDINASPGIEQLEYVSGQNIIQQILQRL